MVQLARKVVLHQVGHAVLVTVIGGLLLLMAFTVDKSGLIALSDAFADVKLPTLEVPGTATVLFCALLVIGAGIGSRRAGWGRVAAGNGSDRAGVR